MENFLLIVLVILFLVIVIRLNKISTKLNRNSKDAEHNFRKLNDKIENLNHLLKEKETKVSFEKISDDKNTSSSVFSEMDEKLDGLSQPEDKESKEKQQEKIPDSIFFQKETNEEKNNPTVVDSRYVISEMKDHENEKTENIHIQKDAKKEKKALDLEKLFGENILSKIGITTLVLGIAYFVKYAIDQNWINETGRVAIGVLIGLGIIGISHKLRAKYLAFSALLAGGGISVLYITITLAFQQYELFSQTTAFIILIIITIFSVLLSLFYNQKILAIFSILGGFASPLLVSSGSGNYITLFSYIFILNIGMLVLAYKKKWFIVSLLSYFLTFGFFISWLLISFEEKNRIGAVSFNLLFFVQFYVLVLIEYFKIRKLTPYQVFVVLSNNFILYISLFYIYRDYQPNVKGIITILMAAINTIPVIMLLKIKDKDQVFFHLLIGIVITFVSLAVPVQLKGSAITMFWAVEAILLLWLLIRTRIYIFKLSFLVLVQLALFSLLIDYVKYYLLNETGTLAIIINPIFITGVVVIISLIISQFLLKKEQDSGIKLFKVYLFSIETLKKTLGGIVLLLLFIFPFTELTYQLNIRNYSYMDIALIQGVYIYLFSAGFILSKRNSKRMIYHYVSIILSILYSIFYLGYIVSYAIRERFYTENFSYFIFALHFLTLPAFIILIHFYCTKNVLKNKEIVYWIASIISVIALSVEIDNIALMVYNESVLGNVHTIVYPVAWGITALILIVAGMKYKKLIFRKISLALFALIILKLYLYDVWKMPQAGRIISFVVLGLILLGTSFLYQKLKVLIKNDDEEEDEYFKTK